MKKLILFILSMSFVFFQMSAQKKGLPVEIKTYITTYFPSYAIQNIVKGKITSYILDDSTTLKFDSKKVIVAIESKEKLPDTVIPAPILEYVNQNYPGMCISDWNLVLLNQQVRLIKNLNLIKEVKSVDEVKKVETEQSVSSELAKDIVLEFDSAGKFVKVVE